MPSALSHSVEWTCCGWGIGFRLWAASDPWRWYSCENNFTHAKDQLAGLDLNAGLVEAFYEGFQQLEELLKSVGAGCDVVRV